MKKHTKTISILFGILVTLLFLGYFIFKTEYIYVIKLWGAIFGIGVIFFPLTSFVLRKFHDGGWIFSKITGLAISSLVMWLLSSLHILKYSTANCYIIIAILAIANIGLWLYKNKHKAHFKDKAMVDASHNFIVQNCILCFKKFFRSEKFKNILITEIIFIVALFAWGYINGYSPEINVRTEMYMDYAYMNSIMNSEYMPVQDIWLAGENINYYYYGQYISGFLCKIAGLQVNEGYNLMISLVAALTFVMPYSIAYNLMRRPGFKRRVLNRGIPVIAALITGVSMCIGGTLHYPIYALFNNEDNTYTYYDQIRYIGYKPDTDDQTATEIPVCMSIAGDLHAHYTNMIFNFTTLALLLQYYMKCKKYNLKSNLLNPVVILLGCMLGIQKMTNFWDFPIYLVIISVTIAVKNIVQNKFNLKNICTILLTILEIVIIQQIVALPFTSHFYISATQINFVNATSPIYKWLVLWGFPTICFIMFFALFIFSFFKNKKYKFFDYLDRNSRSMYALILAACALGLVIIPEIVYVRDIYSVPYERFNTMNKLTPEGYILFCISINYFIMKIMIDKGNIVQFLGLGLLLVQGSTFGYGVSALNELYSETEYIGISNTEKYLKEELPQDYKAIQWMKENISRNSVVLESAVLGSYSLHSRISTFAGNPIVVGWTYHEWIWRANADYSMPEEIRQREKDIRKIYTSQENVKDLIDKYNISYIYIGEMEYSTYSNMNVEGLLSLGNVIYEDEGENNQIYLVEVNKE